MYNNVMFPAFAAIDIIYFEVIDFDVFDVGEIHYAVEAVHMGSVLAALDFVVVPGGGLTGDIQLNVI